MLFIDRARLILKFLPKWIFIIDDHAQKML